MLDKIQTNVDKYLFLIFQKFPKYILKISINISNITKLFYKNVENPNHIRTRPGVAQFFDCLPIYYLLIIAIHDSIECNVYINVMAIA